MRHARQLSFPVGLKRKMTFSALLLSEDAVSAEIPALTVMVCGYDKTGGRMDMTLA